MLPVTSQRQQKSAAPSRGKATPGPCLPPPRRVYPQRDFDSTLGYPGEGPPPPFLWSPLLDGRVSAATLDTRYRPAVQAFGQFVTDHGDEIADGEECDYWLAYYMHVQYTSKGASKSHCSMALHGVEFWMPVAKPLKLARSCLYGWGKLCPPRPYAPMPRDLVYAVAALCALAGHVAPGLAVLLSFDCFLRISEVAGLTVGDIVDHRGQADTVGRGVAVYLRVTKTGRRQAVMIEDPELAEAIVFRAELGPRSREKPALLPSLATLLLGCRIRKGHWAGCICSAALKVSSGWACHGEKTLNPRAARPSADSCSVSGSQAAGSTHDARG